MGVYREVEGALEKDDLSQRIVLFVYCLGTIVWFVLVHKDRLALAN